MKIWHTVDTDTRPWTEGHNQNWHTVDTDSSPWTEGHNQNWHTVDTDSSPWTEGHNQNWHMVDTDTRLWAEGHNQNWHTVDTDTRPWAEGHNQNWHMVDTDTRPWTEGHNRNWHQPNFTLLTVYYFSRILQINFWTSYKTVVHCPQLYYVKSKTRVHRDNKVNLCSFQGHQVIAYNINLYHCQNLKYYY